MHNEDVRQAIAAAGVRYWEVAAKLGIYDGNFSRKLRRELSPEEKQRVLAAVNAAAQEKEGDLHE